jgi:hypothetical protein
MKKLLGSLLLVIPMIAAAQSGASGTWRIDADSAKMDSKPQVFEVKDGMFNCSTCDPKISIKADGNQQPLTGDPYADTLAVTVKDDNTVDEVGMKNGKVSFRATYTVSPDGSTLTEHFEGHPMGSDQAVTGASVYSRVGEHTPGANNMSGSWKMERFEGISDNALTFTYTPTANGMNYQAKTGENYNAKFDGKDYPFHGDPGTTAVVLKKVNDREFEETYKRNGEVTGSATMTISPDGKTMKIVAHDLRRGTIDTFTATHESAGGAPAMAGDKKEVDK